MGKNKKDREKKKNPGKKEKKKKGKNPEKNSEEISKKFRKNPETENNAIRISVSNIENFENREKIQNSVL